MSHWLAIDLDDGTVHVHKTLASAMDEADLVLEAYLRGCSDPRGKVLVAEVVAGVTDDMTVEPITGPEHEKQRARELEALRPLL